MLGGRLSALDGVGPEDLAIPALVARAGDGMVKEVVLALSATMEGQATMHYVAEALGSTGVKVSQLAQGLPMGGELPVAPAAKMPTATRSPIPGKGCFRSSTTHPTATLALRRSAATPPMPKACMT